MHNEVYIAIDLKSFYASVECVLRGLDPLSTNLVVADASRTEKTICLAVSPSLKAWGVSGRPRLFEVISRVREVNAERRWSAPSRRLVGKSFDDNIIRADAGIAVDYITAPPRMAKYIEFSSKIYSIYLKYFAPEDIHVYSIDEVFIDATHYLNTYRCTPRALTMRVIRDVLDATGITATAGIGTNLYLCKVAMDIVAKRLAPDKNGVRIAELDEMTYREMLWEHRPITDFWRVGNGTRQRLERHGMFTMGDIAERSLTDEEGLYRLFGVNAELLIDHAWGEEFCTMQDIKTYQPTSRCHSVGQVMHCPYEYAKARLVTREMSEQLVLELVEGEVVTDQLTLTVGYDTESLAHGYDGEVVVDYYGRRMPRHAHGSVRMPVYTSSTREITEAVDTLFCRIVDPRLLVRRINISAGGLCPESVRGCRGAEQISLFCSYEENDRLHREREAEYQREKSAQHALIDIKRKYGRNAVLKGINLEDGATAIDRNLQIGGHKA